MTDSEIHSPQYKEWAIVLVLILLASGMRFYHLGHKSLWVDEIIASYVSAGLDLKADNNDFSFIYQKRFHDVSPPLRDYMTNIFFRMLGVNEFGIRFIPAVMGILLILFIFYASRIWLGKWPAIIVMTLMVFSPFQVAHSQDGRMYTLFMLLSFLGLFVLERMLRMNPPRLVWLIPFILVNTLNIYVSYFGFWALTTQVIIALFWAYWSPINVRYSCRTALFRFSLILFSLLFILMLYLPWIEALWNFIRMNIHSSLPYQIPFIKSHFSTESAKHFVYQMKPNWEFLMNLMKDFGLPGTGLWIYGVFFISGSIYLIRKFTSLGIGLFMWLIIPIIITFAPPAKVLFFNRYISFMMPIYLMIIGYGIYQLMVLIYHYDKFVKYKNILIAIICLGVISLNSMVLADYYSQEKQNWKDSVHWMKTKIQNGDLIIAGPYNAFWCILFYLQLDGATWEPVKQSPYGGEICNIHYQGKIFTMAQKVQTTAQLDAYNIATGKNIWFISAYYRSYQYRTPSYYNYLESNARFMRVFPARNLIDQIYVIQLNSSVKPDYS